MFLGRFSFGMWTKCERQYSNYRTQNPAIRQMTEMSVMTVYYKPATTQYIR